MNLKQELYALFISLLAYIFISRFMKIKFYSLIILFFIYFMCMNTFVLIDKLRKSSDGDNHSVNGAKDIIIFFSSPNDIASKTILTTLIILFRILRNFISNIFKYPRINTTILFTLVLLFILISIVGTPLNNTIIQENDTNISIEETQNLIFEKSNDKRLKNTDYEKLIYNKSLEKDAKSHAEDMARNNYVSHTSLDGESFQERYKYCNSGENIHQTWVYENVKNSDGYGVTNITSEEEIAQNAIKGWMNSRPHRKNLMNENWESMGIGVAMSENHKVYAVQAFCS